MAKEFMMALSQCQTFQFGLMDHRTKMHSKVRCCLGSNETMVQFSLSVNEKEAIYCLFFQKV